MIRVLVDTNVLVSALVFGGKPAQVLQLVELLGIELVSSDQLERELTDILNRKFRWPHTRIQEACDRIWQGALRVQLASPARRVRDAQDDHVLEAAIRGEAGVVVTGDGDLLALDRTHGIRIVTPGEFGAWREGRSGRAR